MKSKMIRAWLAKQEVRQKAIALELGVTPSAICNWLDGTLKSRRIKEWFLKNGCPERYFDQHPSKR